MRYFNKAWVLKQYDRRRYFRLGREIHKEIDITIWYNHGAAPKAHWVGQYSINEGNINDSVSSPNLKSIPRMLRERLVGELNPHIKRVTNIVSQAKRKPIVETIVCNHPHNVQYGQVVVSMEGYKQKVIMILDDYTYRVKDVE